jgi:hypothetical protein
MAYEGIIGMSPLRRIMILSSFVSLLGIAIVLLPAGYNLEEDFGLGLLYHLRGEISAPKDVVIVAIDEASADDLQLPRDSRFWSRSWYANLVHRLIDGGASVIAFDLMFSMERSLEEDLDFAASIREAGNVVLLGEMRRETIVLRDIPLLPDSRMIIETMIPPIAMFKTEARYIAPFQLPKYPGKVSQYWLFKQTADVVTLPGAALQLHALQAFDELKALLGHAIDDPAVAQATDALNQSARDEALWITGSRRGFRRFRHDEPPGPRYAAHHRLRHADHEATCCGNSRTIRTSGRASVRGNSWQRY